MKKIMYTLLISALLVQAFALPAEKEKKDAAADKKDATADKKGAAAKNPVGDMAKEMTGAVSGAEHEMQGMMGMPMKCVEGVEKGMEQTMGGMGQMAGGIFSLFG